MRNRLWILLFAVFLTACAQTAADLAPASTDQAAATASSAVQANIDIANTLPADVAITVYQGQDALGTESLNLSELLGQGRPVVLNFWAGLCPPCRLEMPDLQAVHEQFGGEIVLLGLDVGPFTALGSNEDGQHLVQELGITYPIGTTEEATVMRNFQVTGMPSTYFITPDGEIIQRWTGLLTEEKLAELVQELIEVS